MVCDLRLLAVLGDAGWHTISPFRGPKGGTGSRIRRWIRPYSSVCLVGMRIVPSDYSRGLRRDPILAWNPARGYLFLAGSGGPGARWGGRGAGKRATGNLP